MSRRRADTVEQYVEAVATLRALRRAEQEEGGTPARDAAIRDARGDVKMLERLMTGGDLGRARRLMAERGVVLPTDR